MSINPTPLQIELEVAILEQVQPWMTAYMEANPNAAMLKMMQDLSTVLVLVLKSVNMAVISNMSTQMPMADVVTARMSGTLLAEAAGKVSDAYFAATLTRDS